MSSRQMIIFRLGHEKFGIDINEVKEIIRPDIIYKVPGTPAFVEGLINLRGKVHTIINPKKAMSDAEIEPDNDTEPGSDSGLYSDDPRIIILDPDTLKTGIIADEANQLRNIDETGIQPLAPAIWMNLIPVHLYRVIG